jgi:hypothetical protein
MKTLYKLDNGEFFTYHDFENEKYEFRFGNSISQEEHGCITISDETMNFLYLFFKLNERKNVFSRHSALEIEEDLILVKSFDKIIFHSHATQEEVLTDWFYFEDFKEALYKLMGVHYAKSRN